VTAHHARHLLFGPTLEPDPNLLTPRVCSGSQELGDGLRQGNGAHAAPYQRPDGPEDFRARLRYLAAQNDDEITGRIHDLDREWDVVRALEANAALPGMTGIALGIFRDRRWLIPPALVLPFLLQYVAQGWCPPL
jgi:hypothetical protein